ncbi:MerR family transcriptional regulator [Roseateles oligotrophus]|uniref:MerR family transcriptional regulator n=1 Tax=Roseateles oligotrophus TaxID=1769250 RepID=A0ABT2YFK4_9BURK|nr:MerR family transcriptional regulator [Roseateles oligotrophus]MCV2368838.1 MerR family transcriptional regulator [Roseateles oligotrophus]
MSGAGLRIGALARLTGASPKALRLYEELGLLPTPRRSGSYRVFEQEHVDAVMLIRQAQSLGFKLRDLQSLATQGPLVEAVSLNLALQAVQSKCAELAEQIAALQEQALRLAQFQTALAGAHELACACPQLQASRSDKK